jgi:Gram-negative bacterial TonB protein C-terminal
MSEKKQCVNCNRGIDTAAKTCLYCNWWQADKPLARPEPAAVEAAPPPPPERRWNNKILGIVAFAALLIIAFVIGSLIHGFEPSEVKAAQQPKTPEAISTEAPAPPTANIPLVPDNSAAPAGPLEQPATTMPTTSTVTGAMGTDATAMTSQQYGVQAVPPPQPIQTIDPRSVTGTVYGQTDQPRIPRPRRTAPPALPARATQTQPVPEYQPVPPLHGHGHARLTLTVGTDGRVRDVDIVQPLPGEMGRLIGSVQSWRFKPATQNGVPVTSRFTVDINVE